MPGFSFSLAELRTTQTRDSVVEGSIGGRIPPCKSDPLFVAQSYQDIADYAEAILGGDSTARCIVSDGFHALGHRKSCIASPGALRG